MNFKISDEEIDDQTHVISLGGEIDLYKIGRAHV